MAEWVALNRYALASERSAPGVDEMVDAVTDLWYHAVYREPAAGTGLLGEPSPVFRPAVAG